MLCVIIVKHRVQPVVLLSGVVGGLRGVLKRVEGRGLGCEGKRAGEVREGGMLVGGGKSPGGERRGNLCLLIMK